MSDTNQEEIVLACEVPEGVSAGELFHVKSPGRQLQNSPIFNTQFFYLFTYLK